MGCLRSGNCCTQYAVCIMPSDIIRIASATGLDPLDFVTTTPEPPERERSEPAILIDGKSVLIILKWKSKRICKFYAGSGCGIYESRPRLCRTYPFKLLNGKVIDVEARACPYPWKPDSDQYFGDLIQYEKDLKNYCRIAKLWNKKGGTLPDFLKFLFDSGKNLK